MRTVVIDYGSGNVRSVTRALEYVAPKDHQIILSGRPEDIANADYLVLPGVGAFGSCYQALKSVSGMFEAIHQYVDQKQRPFLGICVGMQLLANRGEEHGGSEGLGWISGVVRKFDQQACANLAIPHIGWTAVDVKKDHALLKGLHKPMLYFVHSFVFEACDHQNVIAEGEYGQKFCAMVGKDNIVGTQFHPEKSQRVGLQLLTNFLNWRV